MSDSTLLRAEPNVGAAQSAEAGEPVCDVRVDHVTWSCEFRFHGESYGWEAPIFREDELVIGAQFRPGGVRCADRARPASSRGDLQRTRASRHVGCPASPERPDEQVELMTLSFQDVNAAHIWTRCGAIAAAQRRSARRHANPAFNDLFT